LDGLLAEGGAGGFDFAFVDAYKPDYTAYHERIVELLRPGGLVAYDNVLWSGKVADANVDDGMVNGIRALNDRIADDERVSVAMVPIGDGVTLARKR
jgi:caffeoyl-CoA O-methyltransferase